MRLDGDADPGQHLARQRHASRRGGLAHERPAGSAGTEPAVDGGPVRIDARAGADGHGVILVSRIRQRARLDFGAARAGGAVEVDEVLLAAPAVRRAIRLDVASPERAQRVVRRRGDGGVSRRVQAEQVRVVAARRGDHRAERVAVVPVGVKRILRAFVAVSAFVHSVVAVLLVLRPLCAKVIRAERVHEPLVGDVPRVLDVDLPRELHHLARGELHAEPRQTAVQSFVRQTPVTLLAVKRAEGVQQAHLSYAQRVPHARGGGARR